MPDIGSRVRELREARGMHQDVLAKAIGHARSAISGIESGHRRVHLDEVAPLAAALGTTSVELLGIDGEERPYDSRPDTYEHIAKVRGYLLNIAAMLIRRGHEHDASKLVEPELSVFNEYTPKLRDSTYGSDEYKTFLAGMGEGLAHHYKFNDHHPEHHTLGIHGMNLIQLIEMLADWKAATERHADGDLRRSIIQNAERFGYGDDIAGLLMRTAVDMGWLA